MRIQRLYALPIFYHNDFFKDTCQTILFVVANQTSLMLNKLDKSWAFQVFHSKYFAFTMANISNYLYIFERIIGCNLTKMSGTD